jgi:hypothetical protein
MLWANRGEQKRDFVKEGSGTVYLRFGSESIKIEGTISKNLKNYPSHYPLLFDPRCILNNRGDRRITEKEIYLPPVSALEVDKIQAANANEAGLELIHDYYLHAEDCDPNWIYGQCMLIDGKKQIRIRELTHYSIQGNRKWVSGGVIGKCPEEIPIGQTICFMVGVDKGEPFVYQYRYCMLMNQAGTENNSLKNIPQVFLKEEIFYGKLPTYTIQLGDRVRYDLPGIIYDKTKEEEPYQIVITDSHEKFSEKGVICISMNSLVEQMKQGGSKMELTMSAVYKELNDEQRNTLRQRREMDQDNLISVYIDSGVQSQQQWIIWADQAVVNFSIERDTDFWIDKFIIATKFGEVTTAENFAETAYDMAFQKKTIRGLEKIMVYDRAVPIQITFTPLGNNEEEKWEVVTDYSTRGATVVSLAARSEMNADTPIKQIQIPDGEWKVGKKRQRLEQGFDTTLKYKFYTTAQNLKFFQELRNAYGTTVQKDKHPPVKSGKPTWREGEMSVAHLTETQIGEMINVSAGYPQFYLIKVSDMRGNQEGTTFSYHTSGTDRLTTAAMRRIFGKDDRKAAIMLTAHGMYRLASPTKLTVQEVLDKIEKVNSMEIKHEHKGVTTKTKNKGVKTLIIRGKRYSLERKDNVSDNQEFDTDGWGSIHMHYKNSAIGVTGFPCVLAERMLKAILEDIGFQRSFRSTYTWHETYKEDYVLQIQSPEPEDIAELRAITETAWGDYGLQPVEWSIQLQKSLKPIRQAREGGRPKEWEKTVEVLTKEQLQHLGAGKDEDKGDQSDNTRDEEPGGEKQKKREREFSSGEEANEEKEESKQANNVSEEQERNDGELLDEEMRRYEEAENKKEEDRRQSAKALQEAKANLGARILKGISKIGDTEMSRKKAGAIVATFLQNLADKKVTEESRVISEIKTVLDMHNDILLGWTTQIIRNNTQLQERFEPPELNPETPRRSGRALAPTEKGKALKGGTEEHNESTTKKRNREGNDGSTMSDSEEQVSLPTPVSPTKEPTKKQTKSTEKIGKTTTGVEKTDKTSKSTNKTGKGKSTGQQP